MPLGKYNPKEIEPKWAEFWIKNKTYKWEENPNPEKNYLIDSPPPYPYVSLHAGNFLNYTYQDIFARYKRMIGFSVLHPWGWDCHGLPAELHIQKKYNVTAEKIGVKEFRKLCREHLLKNIEQIKGQMKLLGLSVDYDKQYVTMDPSYIKMVQESFIEMYNKGLVYRKEYPVSWCPSCHSAIADAQSDNKERMSELHYIKLPLVDGDYITIATTRPELMPACVSVFVNPNDERYKKYIGKEVKIPFTGQIVKVLANKDVDVEFGTGVVYHCTFGDKDDWKWVVEYNLPIRVVIDEYGKFKSNAGPLKGLSIEEGRKKIIELLKKEGLWVKSEKIKQIVRVCERCKTPLEIIVKKQWYFATTKLKKEIIETAEKMKWMPKYMFLRLKEWVNSAMWDWVISRQRYWATPFPVWYCKKCEKIIIASKDELPVDPLEVKKVCECGGETEPETDVMDTWMDSSITAYRVSKWMKNERNILCNLRTQGEDIIKTWLYYSIARCITLTGKSPFNEVLINGMLLGLDGKKMSKRRKEAAVDPEEIIEKYSADVYRMWVGASTPGDAVMIDFKEMEYNKKFLNKLWNMGKFISMFEGEGEYQKIDLLFLELVKKLVSDVRDFMENAEFGNALRLIRNFAWHEFADYYIEMVKHRLYNNINKGGAVKCLRHTYLVILKLLAPFAPFITEEIYNSLYEKGSIHKTLWPGKEEYDKDSIKVWESIKEAISYGRQWKTNNGYKLGQEVDIIVIPVKGASEYKEDIAGTLKAKEIKFEN